MSRYFESRKPAKCVIRKEMLASREISPELHGVFNYVVKMINLIKNRLFEQTCGNMDVEHKCFLFNTEVRWLTREKSLNRVLKLSEPLRRFLFEKNPHLPSKFNIENVFSNLLTCVTFSII